MHAAHSYSFILTVTLRIALNNGNLNVAHIATKCASKIIICPILSFTDNVKHIQEYALII